MTDGIKGSPVLGYTDQSTDSVALVVEFKQMEERMLRVLDSMRDSLPANHSGFEQVRWLSIAKTHFQEGFMALNRAVFNPQRIKLPEDEKPAPVGASLPADGPQSAAPPAAA